VARLHVVGGVRVTHDGRVDMSPKKRNSRAADPLTALAKSVLARVRAVLDELPLDDAMTAREDKAAQVSARVPREALELTAFVLEREESLAGVPGLDAKEAREALAYIDAMDYLAAGLRTALARVEKSRAKRRKQATEVTFALYGVLRGLDRAGARTVRAHLPGLRKLLTTRKSSRATRVTRAALRTEKKKMRAAKVKEAAVAKARRLRARADDAAAVEAATLRQASKR
jgi:hypothetical protein